MAMASEWPPHLARVLGQSADGGFSSWPTAATESVKHQAQAGDKSAAMLAAQRLSQPRFAALSAGGSSGSAGAW